jgi:hypothetical protein
MPTWLQRAPVLAPAGTLLVVSGVSWTLRRDVDSFGPAYLHTQQRLRRAVLIAIGLMLIGYLAVVRTASEAASVGGLLAEQASSALAGGGRTFRVTRLTDAVEKVLFGWDTKILKER